MCWRMSVWCSSWCCPKGTCVSFYTHCVWVTADIVLCRYVATLESRIQILERQLHEKDSEQNIKRNGPTFTPDTAFSEPQAQGGIHQHERLSGQNGLVDGSHDLSIRESAPSQCQTQRTHLSNILNPPSNEAQALNSDITVLDMLHSRAFTSNMDEDTLPTLPSSTRAKALVDTVYFYTQARYCIVEWTQLREWHRDREAIAYTSTDGPVESQTGKCTIFVIQNCWANTWTGAFFIWIIYAIGAYLVPNPESSTEVSNKSAIVNQWKSAILNYWRQAYFARARIYLPAVMDLQNLTTVQALLCLTQYYFRAPVRLHSAVWEVSISNIIRLSLQYGLCHSL